MVTVRNFGENLRFQPQRLARPTTAQELASVIRGAVRVRAVGAAHSWSPAIVTDDTLVSLDEMRKVIAVDRERRQVTVQAGMRLRELNAHLHALGLALANLGSIDSQSIGGIIATGTHGSGREHRCLSAQVARLELVSGAGEAVTLGRGHPDFDGAVVGLGALGVVHAVTFDVVDAFRLHDTTGTAPFTDVIDRIDEYVGSADHVKLWWMPPCDEAIVYRYRRTDRPSNDSPVRRFVKDRVLSVAVYRALLAVGHLSDRRAIPTINRFLTREAGRPLDRIVDSHVGFLVPSPPVHRESEWAFDARDAKRVLQAYRRLLVGSGHTYNFIQEIRFSKADDLWLSPAYQRDSMWLSLYNIDRSHWDEQLAAFESFARDHGGRPHWGKEAAFDRGYLQGCYAKFDDFARLAARYDPEKKLRNRWIEAIFSHEGDRAVRATP